MSAFRHVITVVLENASRDTVLGNEYMRNLRQKGVFLSNSHCVTHPSQPNYFTMVAGDTMGMVNDNDGWVFWAQTTAPVIPGTKVYPDVTSIVDLLEAKGLTWKAYAECFDKSFLPPDGDLPVVSPTPNSFPPTDEEKGVPTDRGNFARRHVPFLSFPNIVNNKDRVEKIVPAGQLSIDIKNKALPHYCFYTPNLINDGHSLPPATTPKNPDENCNINRDMLDAHPIDDTDQLKNIAVFLQNFLGDDPVKNFPPETLIVITFDESYGADVPYNIYTLLIGDMLEAGTVRHEPYNHYSLLRTIEDNFGLGTLGRNDATATPYWFVRHDK